MAPRSYAYKEFPRMVYGPNGETAVIQSEDERPDGYLNSPKGFEDEAEAKASEAKAKAAAAAEAEERERIKQRLNAHNVDFSPRLGIDKLRALETQLDEHLAAQGAGYDDGR